MSPVNTERDLVFATFGETRLALDLYRAADADAPLVVYAHGGGWRHGDKADDGPARLAPLAAHGVSVAAVNYRLVPDAVFPDQVHDLNGAVRWLRANGRRLGLASEKIGIWGASAGAYLGSLVALTAGVTEFEGTVGGNLDQSSGVQAAVHWFGQSDLVVSASRSDIETRLVPFAFEAGLLGVENVDDIADRARELSLLSRVSPQAPPFLIAHGDRDRVIPSSESAALHHALSRAGVDTTFLLLGGAGHEGAEFDHPGSLAMTAAWLRTVLR